MTNRSDRSGRSARDLVHGASYEVCVSVPEKNGPAPNIYNTAVSGLQYRVIYP
ncbi:hypothetical protein ACIO8F_27750 [Streptomyces sp. NPDC087228]|uniref:hypothetical protein n=1 Tax=unclassified Streptomyces TaxID=2593676 RepID=UPI0033DDD626